MDKEEYKLEEEQVDMGLDVDEEDQDIKDLIFQLEKQDDDDMQEDQDDDDDDDELPKSTRWYDRDTCKVVNGVEVVPNKRKRGERDDLDLCSICLKPWTMDKLHQLSCLPCGHIFGMSCIKDWMEGRSSHKCPQCYELFSFKSVRLLYATRLCIPADQKESIRRFPYNKKGFSAFKQYQRELLTNAFNNRSHALKQRANVLAHQKDAMKRRTELLNRMANTKKRAEALACLAGAEKQEALQCRADALGQRADEYLRKADAFGQQAKALRQRAKASRQRVGAYMASMQFFKQSYKELLGLHDIRSQMDTEEDHKPMEANKEYKQEEEEEEQQQQQERQEQEEQEQKAQEEEEQEQEEEEEEQQQQQQHHAQVDMDLDLDEDDDDDDDDEDDDDDDDDDDYDEDEDEVDDKETSLLPKETSWIDVYSGKTVDGVEVPSNKRKRDEEEEEIVDGVEVPSNKRKRDEEEQQVELELDLDDNDDDFEQQVEEMIFPLVISRIENGKTVYEMEVAVMKDDDFIDDSLYRDDFEPTDSKKDFAEALSFRPPKIQAKAPDVCPICFKHWTSNEIHRVCYLPCGHIFGASCIKKWLQTDLSSKKCPQCNTYCTLEDVRPLNATSIRIPAADKGADDQKTSTRRFPLCNRGIIAFHYFETARRNFALKKWCDAKKRLAGVEGQKNEAMKRRTDLLDRMKALEQQGGSLCQVDALGTLADEYLRRAKACEGRAKALRQRAKAYNQRVNAFQPRLFYFVKCVEDIFKLG